MSRIAVASSIEIMVPPGEVWAVISDFSRNPDWQAGMQRCTWLTEAPLRVGSRYAQEASFLGRTIRSEFEVIALDEGRSVTIDTVEGTFPITVTRTVEPTPRGCRVSADVRGEPTGLLGWLAPITRPLVSRSVAGDYERLKALLEP